MAARQVLVCGSKCVGWEKCAVYSRWAGGIKVKSLSTEQCRRFKQVIKNGLRNGAAGSVQCHVNQKGRETTSAVPKTKAGSHMGEGGIGSSVTAVVGKS